MMSDYLHDKCPPELLDEILAELDLPSLKSLRLASRTLAKRCTSRHFQSFCHRQRTDLSLKDLERLDEIASHPQIGCLVDSLTIIYFVYNAETISYEIPSLKDTYPEKSEEQWQALEARAHEMFEQRAREQENASEEETVRKFARILGKFKKLKRITLDRIRVSPLIADMTSVLTSPLKPPASDIDRSPNGTPSLVSVYKMLHRQGGMYPEWKHAFRIYSQTLSAIIQSGVKLDSLLVYQRARCCAVFMHGMAQHLASLPASGLHTLASLKSVALNVSHLLEIDADKFKTVSAGNATADSNADEAAVDTERVFNVLVDFLSLTPNVESVDLKLFAVQSYSDHRDRSYVRSRRFFLGLANKPELIPRLKRLYLQGFYATAESMIGFLGNHREIEDLTLKSIYISRREGWHLVFEVLDGRKKREDGQDYLPHLAKLRLGHMITASRGAISVLPEWKLPPPGTYWIEQTFNREEIQRGLIITDTSFSLSGLLTLSR